VPHAGQQYQPGTVGHHGPDPHWPPRFRVTLNQKVNCRPEVAENVGPGWDSALGKLAAAVG